MQRVSLMTNCSAICIVAILHFLMPMRVSASDNSEFEKIIMTPHNIVLTSPWRANHTQINVGIFADKNSIYVDLAVGSIGDEKQGASNKWSGYDYRQGYSLIVDGEMINFTLGDLGQSGNFHVLSGKDKIGAGRIMFKSDRDVRWQFTIDINAIQKVLNHDIAQNATITLINPGLLEGEETIRYAGAPTGAWLVTGIGLMLAFVGYYYYNRDRYQLKTNFNHGDAYA